MKRILLINNKSNINKKIVGQILKNAGLGLYGYHEELTNGAIGTLQPSTSGDAPENFDKGKVVTKETN